MPCSDYHDNVYHPPEEPMVFPEQERLDKVTRLLCELLTYMEKAYQKTTLKAIFNHNPNIEDWWEEHKNADAKREAKEKKEREKLYGDC